MIIQEQEILDNCKQLFQKDYSIGVIENADLLCSSYPKQLFIIESAVDAPNGTLFYFVCNTCANIKVIVNNVKELEAMFKLAHPARVRSRFPVPVICYNGKNITRSSTIAHSLECIAKTASVAAAGTFNFSSMW